MHLTHITKTFATTRAVDDVSLSIGVGEIVAIVGENGAGKTTLMRIAAGELAHDGGTIESDGRVELVHQHFMLVGDFTIAENLALAGVETNATGIDLGDLRRRANDLSVGEKAKVELVKAIARAPRVLILDEPTSVLTPHETRELFGVMRTLAENGTAVVFISHKLPEVLAIAQRVIVMRRGRVVAESTAIATSADELARAMVGDSFAAGRRDALAVGRGPSTGDSHHGQRLTANGQRVLVEDELEVHRNEIVAIVGVAGNGQQELAAKLRNHRGAHIPEDRTRDGVVAEMTIAENLALSAPRWRPREAVRHAEQLIALYGIRAEGPHQRAADLSGGNQQKVVLARELDRRPELIVAAEPTRGLDIEATRYVHERLLEAAAADAAIVLITSDLDEAFALADAIYVIYRGRLSERLSPGDASTRVGSLMAGVA